VVAGVLAAGGLVVEAVEEVVVLEELPHPASASTPVATARAGSLRTFRWVSLMRLAPL
jgi:hypothetical protein